MSSIGPQLPPHLSKRKRTPDDDGHADSPSPKRAPANKDEIALDGGEDDSDDGYGPPPSKNRTTIGPSLRPSPPPNKESPPYIGPAIGPLTGPSIGPTLTTSNNTDEIPLDDSNAEDSDAGPAPARPRASGPTAPTAAPKRVMGPALPPGPLSERPPSPPAGGNDDDEDDDDDDDDDDYGPSLPTSTTHQARHTQALAAAAAAESLASARGPQRDDWMLAPPTSSGPADDPTRMRARKFNTGPRATAAAASGGGAGSGEISSIWTETPEQKRKRLEDAVLGRNGTTGSSHAGGSAGGASSKEKEEEERRAEQIRSNLDAARGPSLYTEHQRREGGPGGRIEAEEDDPSQRGFDWEKDMKGSGSRISTAQRRELLNRATDFGGRFSKGKYL